MASLALPRLTCGGSDGAREAVLTSLSMAPNAVGAVKAAIATGMIDADRVGLQGHSWGGYQTTFVTTQTKIFKTAVAGAPLTDMVQASASLALISSSGPKARPSPALL